jgi:hypothetical protein
LLLGLKLRLQDLEDIHHTTFVVAAGVADLIDNFLIQTHNILLYLKLVIKILIFKIVEKLILANNRGFIPIRSLSHRVTNHNKAASVHPRTRRRADDLTVFLRVIKFVWLWLVVTNMF